MKKAIVCVMALLTIPALFCACTRTAALPAESAVAGSSKRVDFSTSRITISKTPLPAGLFDSLAKINSLTVITGGIGNSYTAKNPAKTIAEIVPLLKSGEPYSGPLTQTGKNVFCKAYLGPAVLTAQTADGKMVEIVPYSYLTANVVTERGGVKGCAYDSHTVKNLVQVTVEKKPYYITSESLFNWFQKNQWGPEFKTARGH